MIQKIGSRKILIVEDSPEDFEATVRALRKAGVTNPIQHCEDGDEALDFLELMVDRPRETPCIVLLDLNLPGTSGSEVLVYMKKHIRLRIIPIVILSTSAALSDINGCYAHGASSYINKPVGLGEFQSAIQCFANYWLSVVVLPELNAGCG